MDQEAGQRREGTAREAPRRTAAVISLRDVVESDLELFYQHQADPAACAMAGFRSRDREAFFAHWHTKVLPNPTGRANTILYGEEVAGNAVVFDLEGLRLVG